MRDVGDGGGLRNADSQHAARGACCPRPDADEHSRGPRAHEVQPRVVGGAAADDDGHLQGGDELLEVQRLGDGGDVFAGDDGALDDEHVETGLHGELVVIEHALGRQRGSDDDLVLLDLLDALCDQLGLDGLAVDVLHLARGHVLGQFGDPLQLLLGVLVAREDALEVEHGEAAEAPDDAGGGGRDDAVHRGGHHGQLELVGTELPADVDVVGVARAPGGHDRDVVESVSAAARLAASDLYFHFPILAMAKAATPTTGRLAETGIRAAGACLPASVGPLDLSSPSAGVPSDILEYVSTSAPYDPRATEARRQAVWQAHEAFRTPEADGRPGLYIKPSAPFTSGNIHIGHVRSYAIGDAYARFQRAQGESVLFAFGFDAFGLPAELGAIAGGVSPSEWVERCASHMRGQLERLGFSFDWERAFMSSDANMYRWSQWLFLTLLEHDLIYRGTGAVDWCDTCQTTLATIQVEEGGTCWRCHNPVRLIQRPEWYLRISSYVEENDRRLEELRDWDETSLASQRFVLGRVDGVELDLAAADDDLKTAGDGLVAPGADTEGQTRMLTVFTPHADAIADARFVLMSPKHPQVEEWAADPRVQEQLEELRSGGGERAARDAQAIALVGTGRAVAWPGGAGTLPVLISPVVDGRFGTTAVLGIPDRDSADATIAERLWGPTSDKQERDETNPVGSAKSGPAEAIEPAGPVSAPISSAAAPTPSSLPPPRPAKRFKAGDFAVSRQRSWGTPIPIVYCESCGAVPVPREQLPVVLPLDLKPTGEGNPLAEREDFVQAACPKCGGAGRRETDTLDCHFDALWLWIPACVPAGEREHPLERILALEDLRRWLPSERLVAGTDSGNFVFDQRMVTKALRDIGPLAFLAEGEPFAGCLFHEMVIRDGRKMSKHLGNVVDPDELLERYGADTLRLAVLYAARPQKSLNWSDSAVAHCHRFLKGLWTYTQALAAQDPEPLDEKRAYETEHLRARMEKWLDTAVEKVDEDMRALEMHKAVRNTMRLLERVRDYEAKVRERTGGELGAQNHEVLMRALAALAQLLIPFAPHAGEELWLACTGGEREAMVEPGWPLRRTETVTSARGAAI